jgi:hypothetical protein
MGFRKSSERQRRFTGIVGIGHNGRKEAPVRTRIECALALLALTVVVTACRVGAGAVPAPTTEPASASRYMPSDYHDSSWGVANKAASRPVYEPARYHDTMWGAAQSEGATPVYAPEEYHDSHWDAAYGR